MKCNLSFILYCFSSFLIIKNFFIGLENDSLSLSLSYYFNVFKVFHLFYFLFLFFIIIVLIYLFFVKCFFYFFYILVFTISVHIFFYRNKKKESPAPFLIFFTLATLIFNIFNNITYSNNLFCISVWNFYVKFFF